MVNSEFAFNQNSFALPQGQVEDPDKPYPWIISPVVDFIFVYGGAFWLLFVLHVVCFGWNAADLENLRFHANPLLDQGVAQWFVLMTMATPILISNTHTWATYMRIYGSSEDRERFKDAMTKIGLGSARSGIAHSLEEALQVQGGLGFPVIIAIRM